MLTSGRRWRRGRCGTGKTHAIFLRFETLCAELREFLDRCVVPALVAKWFAEQEPEPR
jgi:hypothetical protein